MSPGQSGMIGGMFRFSLATFLACILVFAIVLSFCRTAPITELVTPFNDFHEYYYDTTGTYSGGKRAPHGDEIALRLAWAEPIAMGLTLGLIHIIRKIWRSQQTQKITFIPHTD